MIELLQEHETRPQFERREAMSLLRYFVENDPGMFRCQDGVSDKDLAALDMALAYGRKMYRQQRGFVRTEHQAYQVMTTEGEEQP